MIARYPLDGQTLNRAVPSPSDEAARLTTLALAEQCPDTARRAIAAREEAALQAAVRAYAVPDLPGDTGPAAPGRGTVEAGEVAVMTYCPRKGDWTPTVDRVVRRALSRTLSSMGAVEQRAAMLYEALVAQRGAMRCCDPSAPSSGSAGKSDGGAAARWDGDAQLARIERTIGDGIALPVRRASRNPHPDRHPRRPIPVRVVVDQICLAAKTVEDVLGAHGWSRNLKNRSALKLALSEALRRMAAVI